MSEEEPRARCAACGIDFSRPDNLRRHVRRVHQAEPSSSPSPSTSQGGNRPSSTASSQPTEEAEVGEPCGVETSFEEDVWTCGLPSAHEGPHGAFLLSEEDGAFGLAWERGKSPIPLYPPEDFPTILDSYADTVASFPEVEDGGVVFHNGTEWSVENRGDRPAEFDQHWWNRDEKTRVEAESGFFRVGDDPFLIENGRPRPTEIGEVLTHAYESAQAPETEESPDVDEAEAAEAAE
jgi:hypothetical protein